MKNTLREADPYMAIAETEKQKTKMTGGKAVVETLKTEGVDTIFGIISIHMLPIYDALREDRSVRLIIPRHEMAGGFMADGYARVSGKVGVYMTSTGPGAGNSMGAVLESINASTQTLQLTGEIETYWKGKNALHEVKDQLGMFNATGAHARLAAKTADIVPTLKSAFREMRTGRAKPQIVAIPIDQQYSLADADPGEYSDGDMPEATAQDLDRAADVLAKAKRPVFWIGGGVNYSGAHAAAERLANILGAGVFTTRGGRGAIDDAHPLVVGNYFGEKPARMFLQSSDCMIAVGTKFSWFTTATFNMTLTKNLIRVDVDPEQLNHNYPAALPIHSDAEPVLTGIANRLEAMGYKPSNDYLAEIHALKEEVRKELRAIRPLTTDLMDRIEETAPRDRVLVTDCTIPAYWGANQYLPVHRARGFCTPRLGAIGPGYPMALGAQAALPNKTVICVAGDGGFVFHTGEFATAVQEKLPVVLLIFNNRSYGVLKRLQEKMLGGRIFATDLHTPDFVKVAEGHGVAGEVVSKPEDLNEALERGIEARAPYVIDIQAPFEN